MTIPNIDNLTAAETKTLAIDCLINLTFEQVVEAIQAALSDDLQVELAMQLYPQIEED